jgi:hypothetical protein
MEIIVDEFYFNGTGHLPVSIYIIHYVSNLSFISACGYSEQARRQREEEKQHRDPAKARESTRRVPYDFTACLAHIEITERTSDGEITRIAGHFDHNEQCQSAALKRIPRVPLHDHVYEVALAQLEAGARYDQLWLNGCLTNILNFPA